MLNKYRLSLSAPRLSWGGFFSKVLFTRYAPGKSWGIFFISISSLLSLTSCTLSFHNITTSGKYSNVVDQEKESSPDVKSDIDIPMTALKSSIPYHLVCWGEHEL